MPLNVSVVAPAYNEAACLEAVVGDWLAYLRADAAVAAFEIIVCNDGSTDATAAILDHMAARNPELKPLHLPQNQGAAAALSHAIAAATLDWIFVTDSDGQFPIASVSPMLAAAAAGALAVIGVRRRKQDSAFARFGSWSSGWLANRFHRSHYRDFNSNCKLVYRPLLQSFPLEAKGLNSSTEITSRLIESGVDQVQVPIAHWERAGGVSSRRSFRSSLDRAAFVVYLGLRQTLLRRGVLRTRRFRP